MGMGRWVWRVALVATMAVVGSGCGSEMRDTTAGSTATGAYAASTATAWFDLQLDLVRGTAGFSPPVASRSFGYTGLALYESVVSGMPAHRSLAGALPGLAALPRPEHGQAYHWPSAANAALAAMLRRLFPTAPPALLAAVDTLEAEQAASYTTVPPAEAARSAAFGSAVAEALFEWSTTDGGHEGYLRNFPATYEPPVGPGLWVSTPPAYQAALQPYWGANRPFALADGSACDPGPPMPYSEEPGSPFYLQAVEVYETVANLTAEQEEIALFWSDDPGVTATPPGHSISILTQVIRQEGAMLDVAAEAYAQVGMAVADAFISCWACKFTYNLLRPVTCMQEIFESGWLSPLNTPPFPEFTSGHSVQSGATAQVLTARFGPVGFTDHTHDARGFTPRQFASFFAAAEEAAISRLYGGIHFREAIELGVDQGRCVGDAVLALPFRAG